MQRPGLVPPPPYPADPVGLALSKQSAQRLDQIGHRFLVGCLGEETRRRQGNQGAWTLLSQSLARLGRREEGLRVDERLVRLAPEHPIAHYNLACSQALNHHSGSALASLERAIELGFHDAEFVLRDADLVSLHNDPAFQRLVARLRAKSHKL